MWKVLKSYENYNFNCNFDNSFVRNSAEQLVGKLWTGLPVYYLGIITLAWGMGNGKLELWLFKVLAQRCGSTADNII